MTVTDKIYEISSLMKDEQAVIIATYLSRKNKEKHCETCAINLDENRQRKVRENKGCYGYTSHPVDQFQFLGSTKVNKFYTCPTNIKSNYYAMLFDVYYERLSGNSTSSVDIMNQPNKLIEAFNFIGYVIQSDEEKKRRRAEALNRGRK